MANTLEYLIRLRDEFSQKIANAAKTSKGSSSDILGDALAIGAGIARMKDTVSAGFDVLTGDYSQLGGLLGKLPGPLGEIGQVVGDTIGGIMDSTIQAAEGFRVLSTATGASVTFLSAFTQAADDERVSAESVNVALEKFGRLLGGVADETDKAQLFGKKFDEILKSIDINTRNADGSSRAYEDVLLDVSDRFEELGPGAEAAALATQLFGKKGSELIPILVKGRDGIKEMMQSATDAGLVITDDTVAAVDQLKRAQDQLADSAEAVGTKIGTAVIPVVANVTTGFNLYLEKAQQIAENNNIVERTVQGLGNAVDFLTGKLEASNSAADVAAERWQALGEAYQRANGGSEELRPNVERLNELTQDSVAPLQEYSEATQTVAERDQELAEITRDATDATQGLTEAQKELQDRTKDVTSAITGQAEAMDEAERVQTALKLATGQITEEEFEAERATKAVMLAVKNQEITEAQAVQTLKGLADGTLGASYALAIAGRSATDFKRDVQQVESAARGGKTEVNNLGTAMNNVKSRDVKLTVRGVQDTSFTNTRTDFQSVKDSSATKTAFGAKHQSFDPMRSDYGSVYSQDATKTAKGNREGSFNTVYQEFHSVKDGTATIRTTVTTDVIIHYDGSGGRARSLLMPGDGGVGSGGAGGVNSTQSVFNASAPVTVIDRGGVQAARQLALRMRQAAQQAQLRAAMGG